MDVSILTSGHDVSDARLHRLAAAFLRADLRVEVLGLGDPAQGPSGTTVRARPRPPMLRRAMLAAEYAARAQGTVLVALDPDSLVAAMTVGRARGRRVVADVHEDYLALLSDRAWAAGVRGRVAGWVAGVANVAASRADLTMVADDHVPPHRGRSRIVVTNAPDTDLLPDVGAMDPAPVPTAVYIGDLRRSRGLFTMLEAVAATPGWRLELVGRVAASDLAEADEVVASRPGLAPRVTFHGQLPPAQSWQVARRAWVGLCLLQDTPAFRDAMPSKVSEYLACGLPVVTTDLPRPGGLIRSSGAGAVVPCGPPDTTIVSTSGVLSRWAADPDALAGVQTRAAALGRDIRASSNPYDRAASLVADLVGSTAPTRRTP